MCSFLVKCGFGLSGPRNPSICVIKLHFKLFTKLFGCFFSKHLYVEVLAPTRPLPVLQRQAPWSITRRITAYICQGMPTTVACIHYQTVNASNVTKKKRVQNHLNMFGWGWGYVSVRSQNTGKLCATLLVSLSLGGDADRNISEHWPPWATKFAHARY